LELATEVNLSPTGAVLDKMLSASEIATHPPVMQALTGVAAPQAPDSSHHTEITFIPTPVNLATGYLHWWGKSSGVPAACQCRWCGLVGSESLATVPL